MNYIYCGLPADDNVGNGKSVSMVGEVVSRWVDDPKKVIYSNIKLKEVDYTEFTPENVDEAIEAKHALIILDELHAIVHKNHKISETCKKHGEHIGLCYRLAQCFRQIRKNDNDSYSTCQTFMDAPYQYRTLMQRQVVCEKLHLQHMEGCDKLKKCESDVCPEDHRHYIRQTLYKNTLFVKELPLFDPVPFYPLYDSFEVVKGWVTYE